MRQMCQNPKQGFTKTRVSPMTDFAARRTMMVDTQVRPSDVTKFPIIDAMLRVPREAFVPARLREVAYLGENLDLGGGRVVLAPRTLAKMLDALDIEGDDLVLDIGASHGYSAAVMARLAEVVVGVEDDAALVEEAQRALGEAGADNVVMIEAALPGGAPDHGPYDVIVVEGAVEHLPDAITGQLKEGGRIACLFAEGALGVVRIGYKIDGRVNWRDAFNAGAPVLPGFERHAAFTL
jgi:protein-L-isoaspartate(D-aspartate) O-methyltransferase